MFESDPNNNIPGLCNRLHCRSTKPPTGESCKGAIPLLEGKGISHYACSSNSKCTRHSRVVSQQSDKFPLLFRYLQIRMIQALHLSNQNFDVPITLDHNSLAELHWWVSNITSVNSSPIRPPAPTLFITTDASKTGWGAVCESQRTNGRWSDSERTQHINVLELKAAFLALKSFLNNQSHKVVYLRMDNTTAVAHVNDKGGTHSPCLLALTYSGNGAGRGTS